MFTNQRKMMRTKRNSEWRLQQKPYQSQGELIERSLKYHSKVAIKTKKMMELEKIMFHDETAPLRFKVASNHLILKNIMSHLSFPDLKTARLVSKDWKNLANSELRIKRCCKVNFWGSLKDNPDYLNILMKSDDLSWIEFDCKYLNEKHMDEFASDFGHQVKILKIRPCKTFWNLLGAGKFPNLEILKFTRWTVIHESSCNDLLLNRISNFDTDSVGDIIWPVPNLQRIEGIRLSQAFLIPSEIVQHKSHLIKTLKLDCWRCVPDSPNHITVLAQAKPKLERLKIEQFLHDSKWVKLLYLILESSRESLRFLKKDFTNFELQLFQFKSFSRLSTIHLKIDFTSELSHLVRFLESCQQDSLPNLKTVKFKCNYWLTSVPDSFGASPGNIRKSGVLSSVVNFELGGKRSPNYELLPCKWFPWLFTLFPNVQSFTLGSWKDADQILLHVFTGWPKLISLKIHTFHHAENPRVGLDPVFTGLSPEKCEELRKLEPEKMMREDIVNGGTWPNLHSLKELKRLDIFVTGLSSRFLWSPLSLVSFLHAINLKPELKTTIHFPNIPQWTSDFRKLLQPLAPYAKLEENSRNSFDF